MGELELLVGVSVRPWADALHAFCEDHGGARVRGRVIDEDGALAQDADVLVVDDTSSFLSGRLVDRLHDRGVAVVVIADARHLGSVAEWVTRLGVDAVVPDDEPVDRIVAVAASLGSRPRSRQPQAPVAVPSTSTGRVVAVAGVSGGVGATEVTIGIASQLDGPVVVVDLDLGSPSIAQRLALPLHPNLRSALGAHRAGQGLDGHLHRRGSLLVLGGPSSAGEWAGIEADDLRRLVGDLARDRTVVVNLPAGPPRAHPHGAVTVADVTRSVLGIADRAVAVSLPTPVGLARAFEWVAAVDGLLRGDLHLALNRSARSVYQRSEARSELGVVLDAPVWFLPDDVAVARSAWAGAGIGRGRFRRAVARLAKAVA